MAHDVMQNVWLQKAASAALASSWVSRVIASFAFCVEVRMLRCSYHHETASLGGQAPKSEDYKGRCIDEGSVWLGHQAGVSGDVGGITRAPS